MPRRRLPWFAFVALLTSPLAACSSSANDGLSLTTITAANVRVQKDGPYLDLLITLDSPHDTPADCPELYATATYNDQALALQQASSTTASSPGSGPEYMGDTLWPAVSPYCDPAVFVDANDNGAGTFDDMSPSAEILIAQGSRSITIDAAASIRSATVIDPVSEGATVRIQLDVQPPWTQAKIDLRPSVGQWVEVTATVTGDRMLEFVVPAGTEGAPAWLIAPWTLTKCEGVSTCTYDRSDWVALNLTW